MIIVYAPMAEMESVGATTRATGLRDLVGAARRTMRRL